MPSPIGDSVAVRENSRPLSALATLRCWHANVCRDKKDEGALFVDSEHKQLSLLVEDNRAGAGLAKHTPKNTERAYA